MLVFGSTAQPETQFGLAGLDQRQLQRVLGGRSLDPTRALAERLSGLDTPGEEGWPWWDAPGWTDGWRLPLPLKPDGLRRELIVGRTDGGRIFVVLLRGADEAALDAARAVVSTVDFDPFGLNTPAPGHPPAEGSPAAVWVGSGRISSQGLATPIDEPEPELIHDDGERWLAMAPKAREAGPTVTSVLVDMETGQPAATVAGRAVAFSPAGDRLVTFRGSWREPETLLWELPAAKLVASWPAVPLGLLEAGDLFSPDGAWLITARDAEFQLVRAATGEIAKRFEWTYQPGFSGDGRYLAGGTGFLGLELLDLATLEPAATASAASFPVGRAACSRTGEVVAIDHVVSGPTLWPTASETLRQVGGRYCAFLGDGDRVITQIAEPAAAAVWDAATGERLQRIPGDFAGLSGDKLLVLRDGVGAVIDPAGTVWVDFAGDEAHFTPDGARLLVVRGETTDLWDLATGRCLRSFDGRLSACVDNLLVTGSRAGGDEPTQLWDLDRGRHLGALPGWPLDILRDGAAVLTEVRVDGTHYFNLHYAPGKGVRRMAQGRRR